MSTGLSIPEDFHQQLRERAAEIHATVDEFAVFLMRAAISSEARDYLILKKGRFACFGPTNECTSLRYGQNYGCDA